MCSILPRIQQISDEEGITIGAMERSIGASKGVLSRAINNGTDIQSKWIQKVVENYPKYSASWLLTGQGSMLKEGEQHADERPRDAERIQKLPDDQPGGLPLIPIEAVAGFPAWDNDGVGFQDCDRYVIPEFQARGAQFIVRVSGHSMEPTYQNGDLLGCCKIESATFFQWGEAYVLDTNQGALVKRLFPVQGNKNAIQCVSDNQNFPPFELQGTDIRSVSTIVGLVRLT